MARLDRTATTTAPSTTGTALRAYDTAWQRRLFDAGYAGINWPKEYGGRGATPPSS